MNSGKRTESVPWNPSGIEIIPPESERNRPLRSEMTTDFFRARLDPMIDLKHPLATLAQCLRQLTFAYANSLRGEQAQFNLGGVR